MPTVQIMQILIRILAAAVALLFLVQLWVVVGPGPAPAVRPSAAPLAASGPPTPVGSPVGSADDLQVGAPMELNWLLCRIASSPDVAPRGEQKQQMLQVLEKSRAYTEQMNPLWVESQGLVRATLTPDQCAFIVRRLQQMRGQNQRIGGGPMNTDLLELVRRKLGHDFMDDDLQALLKAAREIPASSRGSGADSLNPEDFTWGVTVLEASPTLALTHDQAVRIAPYVKVQTDLFQSHQREKSELIGLLTPAQKDYARTLRRSLPADNPSFSTVADVITALQSY